MHHENSKIIESILNGERSAFSSLYAIYADIIYNTALSYSKNIQSAEDITQDVFVKVFKNLHKFNKASSLKTWIYRITINTSINHINKTKRIDTSKNNIEAKTNTDFNHPGVLLENKENAATLYQAIEFLTMTQKTAFILAYIEGLPQKEIADIMETTLKSVESLLQRAKANLRTELEKIYIDRRK